MGAAVVTFSIIMGGACRHVLGVLQGLVCPYLNPHFYHEMREANLLVMLGMLAGHAGDVEDDADDVDGLEYVHFARKCYKL